MGCFTQLPNHRTLAGFRELIFICFQALTDIAPRNSGRGAASSILPKPRDVDARESSFNNVSRDQYHIGKVIGEFSVFNV
jgi:hypothetical protein